MAQINEKPLVSVITIVYNCEQYIEQCIKSIENQTYKNIEYIIIDGKSTDNTINLVNKHIKSVGVLVSEKDKGISDAFNKGISMAKGEIIGIINADDYYNSTTIEEVVEFYLKNNKQKGIYYGNLRYFDDTTSYIRISELSKIWRYMSLNHPSMFVTPDVYKNVGGFSLEYKYVMDAEFIHRALFNKTPFFYIDKSLANFRMGGTTEANYTGGCKEFYKSVNTYKQRKLLSMFWYRWAIIKKKTSQTKIGNFFYQRKHLIAPLLSGRNIKG